MCAKHHDGKCGGVVTVDGLFVGKVFVHELQFFAYEPEEGVEPADAGEELAKEAIDRMPLADVDQLVPEDNAAIGCISRHAVLPEEVIKE